MGTIKNSSRAFRMQTVIEVAGGVIGNNEPNEINLAEIEKICGNEAGRQKFNIKDLILDNLNLVAYAAKLRTQPRQKNRYGTEN